MQVVDRLIDTFLRDFMGADPTTRNLTNAATSKRFSLSDFCDFEKCAVQIAWPLFEIQQV